MRYGELSYGGRGRRERESEWYREREREWDCLRVEVGGMQDCVILRESKRWM